MIGTHRSSPRLVPDRPARTRLRLETLEDRRLLSLVPAGSEFQVNSFTTDSQSRAAVATDVAGNFVVAWEGSGQGDSNGIFAQLYNADGVPQGGEFRVNSHTPQNQLGPTVAMDASGDFVVAWISHEQDGSEFGIFARRYNAAGVPQGNEFQVNTITTGFQSAPSVAMDADGDFVVAWEASNQDGDGPGIYAQRYDAAGAPQGTEFRVNTHTTERQRVPSIGMDADGDFVVAWMSRFQDGDNYGIYAQRYDAAGVPQGTELPVNSHTTSNQQHPHVAVDADGDFVVAWHSTDQDGHHDGIYAQRYSGAGAPQGSEFNVNSLTTHNQRFASVALSEDGDFVVAWLSYYHDGDSAGIFARRYDAAGVAQGPDFQVNSYTTSAQRVPSLAVDADGDVVVVWTSYDGQDGDDQGIFAQRYVDTTVGSEFQVNTYTTNFQGSAAVATDADGDFVVSWSGSGEGDSNTGVFAQLFDSTGAAQGSEFRVNTFTTGSQGLSSVTMDADGNFVVVWRSSRQEGAGAGAGIYGQRYNAAGVAQGSEFRVNTYTTSSQDLPSVAMDADGDFVVVWQSGDQDGGGGGVFEGGIYAQRYDAAGVPQGSEFRVNTYTTDGQLRPAVAMSANGDFVVAWQSREQDGQANGIFAQRYDASGAPQGGEFQANSYTTDQQAEPAIAMDANGNFVVAWHSAGQDGSGYGVYAQRYNAAGVAQGSEFPVNTFTSGSQRYSTVAMDANGDFIVAWEGDNQDDLFNLGVFAQRYSAAGIPQGGEFRVHSHTTDQQRFPAAAMDAEGDFVVAWQSEDQDGSGYGVYAQRYRAFPANPSSVVGRHLFYNESAFDGDTPGINPSDSAAIAIDKSAYLPGSGPITPTSMSSYSRGVNGVFVDITGPHATLSLADFEFATSEQGTSANNAPSTWAAAPAPVEFTVLSDTPAAGTDRVEFIWPDNDIENRYLEVRVLGNDAAGGFNVNTGLAATDVFYFGNIIGDTFVSTPGTVFLTSAADETEIQAQIISPATITSIHDVDRNGIHLASDRVVTRGNTITALARINIGDPPAAPAASGVVVQDGAGSAVATALALPTRREASGDGPSSVAAAPVRAIEPRGRRAEVSFEPVAADDPRAGALLAAVDKAVNETGEGLELDDEILATLATETTER